MSKHLTRRGLFGLFRPSRSRANGSGGGSVNAAGSGSGSDSGGGSVNAAGSGSGDTDTRFSLEDFYRRRAADGAARAPVPRKGPRADLSARGIATTDVGVPDLIAGRRKP